MPKTSSTTDQKQAKSSFSADFLLKIKQSLMNEKEHLERDLANFSKRGGAHAVGDDSGASFPNYGDKEDENAAEVAEYAANLSLGQDFEKILRDVNESLNRLAKGTYGICKYCKKSIQEKRLLARPTSSACVECKKAIIQEV